MFKPETSIIIRTFNEEKHLGNLLRAIRKQDYQDCEIIVVDSGSTDRTLEIAEELADSVLQIESKDFTYGHSLNVGCQSSKGKYIVLVSAHILPVDNQWLSNLLAPLSNKRVAMVYGKQIGSQETKFSEKRDFKKAFSTSLLKSDTFPYYVNNANSVIRKELWEEHPFDKYLLTREDIEWAKYVIKKGFIVYYEPKAVIHHIHEEKWAQIFNRYRREAIATAKLGFSRPPLAQPSFFWLGQNLLLDLLATIPNISWSRIKEIGLYRYYQWKGTRQGWYYDRDIDVDREKDTLYYPES